MTWRIRPATQVADAQIWAGNTKIAGGITGDANARLIAAAPDMLDALRQIAKGEGRFSRDPLTHAGNTIDDMIALAHAAIAKAGAE